MARRNHRIGNSKLLQKAAVPALAVILFFAVCLSSAATAKLTAVIFLAAAFIGGFLGFKQLRERFTLPMAALGLFVLMGGISTFYAVSGKFALAEFLKLLFSFSLAVFMLAAAPGRDAAPGRRIASVLECFTAIAGLVSIDMISTRLFSGAVTGLLSLFSSDYSTDFTGLEVGTRITSIFQNPNVFASVVGLGVILSLALVLSSETKRERSGHVICLYCNALSFLLVFSMGAIAFIAAAFLLYLLLELPARRASLFVLMVETLLLTVVSTALISVTSFEEWSGLQIIPILCAVVGAAALWAADRFVGQALGEKLASHGKLLAGMISGVLAAVVVFALLAYNLTGPATMATDARLRRSVYPAPGEYTIHAQIDGHATVMVLTQNEHDTMMHTETLLYSGKVDGATFTVPEDSMVLHLVFASYMDTTLESVELVGPETVSVPLGYKLLPSFIANRLQGLFANENAIQRAVFFEDGMKLFRLNPVFGRGLGSYENGIKSVQSFFYETKYTHNHYIQTLTETGIVGLVTFVIMLGTAAAAVWFDRRKKDACHPLTPALGAALLFMAGHAATEVIFSFYAYLPMAFSVIALIALCCGQSIPLPEKLGENIKKWSVIGCAALAAVFAVFLFGNISANMTVKSARTMDNLEKAAASDQFEYADHMLAYVLNAEKFRDDAHIQDTAAEYAKELAELDSNSIPIYLSAYYFGYGQVEDALLMIEKHLRYSASDPKAWEDAMKILQMNFRYIGTPEYDNGVRRIVAFYNEWNENNIGTITLSDTAQGFLKGYGLGKDN